MVCHQKKDGPSVFTYAGYLDPHPVWTSVSAGCESVLGIAPPRVVQHNREGVWLLADHVSRVTAAMQHSVQTGEPYHLTYEVVLPDQRRHWVSDMGEVERREAGAPPRIRGFVRCVTLDKQLEQATIAQRHIFELMAGGIPLDALLQKLVDHAEAIVPGMHCSILLLDQKTKTLCNGAFASLPDWYVEAVDGLPIGEGVGSCGTAAFTGERTVVADILDHPNWKPFRSLAEKLGLRACWSEPVKSEGVVLGTFAMYYPEPRVPTPPETALIRSYAHVVSIALCHHKIVSRFERTRRDLDEKIRHQNEALQEARLDLIEAAHLAGMAEIATSMLHNVGNILNSFRVASQQVKDLLDTSVLHRVESVVERLNAQDMTATPERESQILAYLANLQASMAAEHQDLRSETDRMVICGERILEIVQAQHKYSLVAKRNEYLHLGPLVEDALQFMMTDVACEEFELVKEFDIVSPVKTQKIKLLNAINWVLNYCRTALLFATAEGKQLSVRLRSVEQNWVDLRIAHNGRGVPIETVKRLLSMSGPSDQELHDLSLHMAANYMDEMGGSIDVVGNGDQPGVCFLLRFHTDL